ncbi:hypothetical protein EVAR_38782_1 [Eumeta japonica]|uniref:Uncharacterized protein n=1 Tax=Eumeta variegata TaxID=151549 RepID=A0A4C1WIZ7_EUMVA|nr:hypothetical protein EVAR_38782_1 [Eumeta japonica]
MTLKINRNGKKIPEDATRSERGCACCRIRTKVHRVRFWDVVAAPIRKESRRRRGVGEEVIPPLFLPRGENVCLFLLFHLNDAGRLRECARVFVLQPATHIHRW